MMLESGIPRRLTVRYLTGASGSEQLTPGMGCVTFQGHLPCAVAHSLRNGGLLWYDGAHPVVEPVPRCAYKDCPIIGVS
jgi:hypothetical protein